MTDVTMYFHKLARGILNQVVFLSDYHKNIKPKPEKKEKKGYICKICGYVYEGDELPDDFVCPICKHGASDFEKM